MPASIISRMVIARVEIIGENCDIDDIGEGFCHCYICLFQKFGML